MTELPPTVLENLQALPQPMQEQMSRHVLGLGLEANVLPDEGAQEISPDQPEISERVLDHMSRASKFIGLAYDELASANTESGQEITQAELVPKAKELAITSAKDAKANGDSPAAVKALETVIVLDTLASLHVRHATRLESVDQVDDAIAAGLATEIVQAAHNTRGLVNVQEPDDVEFDSRKIVTPAGSLLDGKKELLMLASGYSFSSSFDHINPLIRPGQPQEDLDFRNHLQEELDPMETIILARLSAKEKNNVAAAADLALKAVGKIDSDLTVNNGDGERIADLLKTAADLCGSADSHTSTPEYGAKFTKELGRLRHVRSAGDIHYRGNSRATSILDETLVSLVQQGQLDLAKVLISSANSDSTDTGVTQYSNFSYLLRRIETDFGAAEKDRIGKIIDQLHVEKLAELKATLTAQGVNEGDIEYIIGSTHDPDCLADVNPLFWQKSKDYYSGVMQRVLEYHDVPLMAEACLAIDKAGLMGDVNIGELLRAIGTKCSISGAPNSEVIAGMIGVYKEVVDGANDGTYTSNTSRTGYVAGRLIKDFEEPAKAWEICKLLYGKEAITNFADIERLFAEKRGVGITDETVAAFTELKKRFQGICDVADILPNGGIDALQNALQIEPSTLSAVLQRISPEAKNAEWVRTAILDKLSRSLDQAEFLEAFSKVDQGFIDLLNSDESVNGFAVSYAINWLSEAGRRPENIAEQINNVFMKAYNAGMGSFFERTDVGYDVKIHIAEQILRVDVEPERLARQLDKAYEMFGDFVSTANLELLSALIEDQQIPDRIRELGVTKPGEAGIEQLKAFLGKFSASIYETGEVPTGMLIRHPFLRDYFKQITRYASSSWGRHDDHSLEVLLTTSERFSATMHPDYQIGEAGIEEIDREAEEAFKISEDAVSEWRSYALIVQRAREIMPADGDVNWEQLVGLLHDIQVSVAERDEQIGGGITKLEARIETLRQKQEDTAKLEAQLAKQQASRERLASINYSSVEDFDIAKLCEQIMELAEHKSILGTGLVQTLLVATAFIKAKQEDMNLPDFKDVRADKEPTLEDIRTMADVIGHITNRETWQGLFRAVGGQKQLDNLLSVDALSSNIDRSNSISTSGVRTMRFIPTRGPLMELSGHIGDACWASKYDSIAGKFPNMTAVIMVQNPESSSRRLAGSVFLMETTSASGERLLVIRGLNPIQNIINQLSAESFFTEFTTYAQGIAAALDRRLAVVIDGHSGGSATNRPNLFEYLTKLKPSLQPVQLASEADTTFNGYNIVDNTYLVPEPSSSGT